MSAADTPTAGRKDDAHIDRDWVVRRRLIDGVKVREVRNIVTGNGITTELYRPDWSFVDGTVEQAIHVALRQALADEHLAVAARAVHAAGRRFGFGGIGGVDDDALPMPTDLVYAEYARLAATAALMARAFPTAGDLARRVAQTRARLASWRTASPAALAAAHAELSRRAAALTIW
jgi:hypothetical protein